MFRRFYRKFIYQGFKSLIDNSICEKEAIPESIHQVKQRLDEAFSECADYFTREIEVGDKNTIIMIAYMNGLVKKNNINSSILKPILTDSEIVKRLNKDTAIDILKENVLINSGVEESDDMIETIEQILSGKTAIFTEGGGRALVASTIGYETRSVSQPDTDVVVRGPREGFTEALRTNIALIRRKIKNPDLKFEKLMVGKLTKTTVCVSYIKNLANDQVIQSVKKKLGKINIDSILESGYIEEYIEDAPMSIFATVGNTEKPDIVAAKLLEGRVAILCDGTPFALTVPYLFIETIQASEDYYSRPFFSSFLRLVRLLALIISTIVPALYVALINFHQDMIPTELTIRIAASRQGLPISAFFESLAMVIIFELLREAGIRMPRSVGQAVNIVGALVIGQAAVEAGLVSNIMVIVIAITAISSFIITPLVETATLMRIVMLIAANLLGLMGIGLAITALFVHMCSLRSFGVPFMAPISPITVSDLKDTIVRVPIWAMLKRPRVLDAQDGYRM